MVLLQAMQEVEELRFLLDVLYLIRHHCCDFDIGFSNELDDVHVYCREKYV